MILLSVFPWRLLLLNSSFCSPFLFYSFFSTIAYSMSSLIVLQQRLFELHGISPSADRDAQIAVLFSDLHRLMQPLLSPVPALVLPRKEPLLSSSSSTIAPIDLALMPSPEAPAPILPVFPSPTHPSAVLTPSSSVNGAFFIFYFILFYFLFYFILFFVSIIFIYIYIYISLL